MTVKRRSSEREHYTGDGCELLPHEHPLVKEHELSVVVLGEAATARAEEILDRRTPGWREQGRKP